MERQVGEDVVAIREMLGLLYTELLEVMIDVGVPPLFLDSESRARVAEARDRAMVALEDWAAADPEVVAVIVERLPEGVRFGSTVDWLLRAAVWPAYADLPESLFLPPRADSRVFATIPRLVPRLDDDGLLDIRGLHARPHGLLVDGYSLHHHQFLRRNFGSGIHYQLIGSLLELPAHHDVTVRLAIDDRRLRFAHEHEEFSESDHWFGRPLTDDVLDDLAATGETFLGDPDGGQSFMRPYAGLSARWTTDESLHTIQVEEFMPTYASEPVLARYLHAIRDTSTKTFIHCDGAVKAYDPESYPRSQAEFRDRGKGLHYRKVFRVDGSLPGRDVTPDLMSCSWAAALEVPCGPVKPLGKGPGPLQSRSRWQPFMADTALGRITAYGAACR